MYKAQYGTPAWPADSRDEVAVATLQRALLTGKVSHAYLFLGSLSPAKTEIVEIFAMALLCTGENKPCGLCRHCRLMEANSHPDYFEIVPEGNSIRIAQVRALIGSAHLTPTEAFRKVYTLRQADAMTEQAANALLKLLEEPPAPVTFLLMADTADLPATILSRCQIVRFGSRPEAVDDEQQVVMQLAREWFFLPHAERLSRAAKLPREREHLEVLIDTMLWLIRDAYIYLLGPSPGAEAATDDSKKLSAMLTESELRRLWQRLLQTRRMLVGNVNRRALSESVLWGYMNEVN
jgi:DNA polymerase III delta' subunit